MGRSEKMSAADCAWLRMERPTNLLTVTVLMRLDGPLDHGKLRTTLEERLLPLPRFRQRLAGADNRFRLPRWEDDPFFNLDAHLLRASLRVGDEGELQQLVGDLMSVPLDSRRPLWQVHAIDNVQGGSALVCRLHHCIADGQALTHVLHALTDESPVDHRREPASGPSGSGLRRVFSLSRGVLRGARRAWRDRAWARGQARRGVDSARALASLALLPADPRSALKGPVGTEKAAAWSLDLPLHELKVLGREAGGTLNDLLVSVIAGAIRRQLLRAGERALGVEDVRAVVPVDLRKPHERNSFGNHFGLMFLPLPVGMGHSELRLHEVVRRTTELKTSPEASVALGVIQAMGLGGWPLQRALMRFFARKATLVLTNVKGPKEKRRLAGRRLDDVVAWVPQPAGLGLGVAIFSYAGRVRIGVASDANLMPRPDLFVEDLHEELRLLRKEAPRAASDEQGLGASAE